jgi:YfiH family protein
VPAPSTSTTAAAGAAAAPSGVLAGRFEAHAGTRYAFSDLGLGNVSLVVGPQEDLAGARERLGGAVGLDAADLVFMEQVHGPGVAVVGLADRGRGLEARSAPVPGVDALVTTDPDVGLIVLVADCVPVLLAVPGSGVAAVHAGREGVAGGVVGAASSVLAAETGAAPEEVRAIVGPAVGPCCYEVPRALQLDVVSRVGSAGATTSWGAPSLDLPGVVRAQLLAAGVADVERVGGCTVCSDGAEDGPVWFSHRATTNDDAPAGRQAGVIAMTRPEPAAAPPRSADPGSLESL